MSDTQLPVTTPAPSVECDTRPAVTEQPSELALREYDHLRGQERDIMQSLFGVGAGAISLLSLFSAVPGYGVIIVPLILGCLARYLRGGAITLRTIRPYLREFETRYGHQGYECYYDDLDMKEHGSRSKAVRDILLLCELLTVVVVSLHSQSDNPQVALLMSVITILIVAVSLVVTWRWMKTPPKPRKKEAAEGRAAA
jgi:hypothetical protein